MPTCTRIYVHACVVWGQNSVPRSASGCMLCGQPMQASCSRGVVGSRPIACRHMLGGRLVRLCCAVLAGRRGGGGLFPSLSWRQFVVVCRAFGLHLFIRACVGTPTLPPPLAFGSLAAARRSVQSVGSGEHVRVCLVCICTGLSKGVYVGLSVWTYVRACVCARLLLDWQNKCALTRKVSVCVLASLMLYRLSCHPLAALVSVDLICLLASIVPACLLCSRAYRGAGMGCCCRSLAGAKVLLS